MTTESRKCSATSKGTGQRCRRTPAPGATVCRFHGGAAPQVQAKAALRVAEQAAQEHMARMSVGPVDNPLLELRKLAARALAWEALFEEKRRQITEWRYQSGTGEQLRAEVAIVERAMDRCAAILTAIARLNLDERLVRLEEAKAALVERLILDVFADLRLTDDQTKEGRRHLGRRLHAVTA